MSQLPDNIQRVLAIDPYPNGFGFAVLEEPLQLVDFGIKVPMTKKADRTIKKLENIINYYRPDVLILEDRQAKECKRRENAREVLLSIEKLASYRSIEYIKLSWPVVHQVILPQDSPTKYTIAVEIAKRFPELQSYLPRPRKAWMTEVAAMNIFDATALALCFYLKGKRK